MATAVTLTNISELAAVKINVTETDLASGLSTLGPDSSAADLLKFQTLLAINSTITAVFSAVAKERADTLKGVVQKF